VLVRTIHFFPLFGELRITPTPERYRSQCAAAECLAWSQSISLSDAENFVNESEGIRDAAFQQPVTSKQDEQKIVGWWEETSTAHLGPTLPT